MAERNNLDGLPKSLLDSLADTKIQDAIRSYQQVCNEFSSRIKSWARNSTDAGMLAKRDRLRLALLHDFKIKTLVSRIDTWENTLALVRGQVENANALVHGQAVPNVTVISEHESVVNQDQQDHDIESLKGDLTWFRN